MKRKTAGYTLPFQILFTIFYLLIVPFSFAQDCKTEAANKPAALSRSTDNIVPLSAKMNVGEMAKMKPYLAKAESWVKNMLAGFTGAKLHYHNNYFPKYLSDAETTDRMFIAAGIKGHYQSQMMFFEYYCYDNKYPIHTEGESGSTVYINFNNVYAFRFMEGDGANKVFGRSTFQILKKKKTEGRIDFYEEYVSNNEDGKMFVANEFIFIRNSDKPVFLPVTRKEYLQQMLQNADANANSNSKLLVEGYESNKKMFELEMKVYKEMDKSYTPEKEAKRRKWFEEDQEKLTKLMSKTNPDATAAKEVISQYLQKPTEWLDKSINDIYISSYSKINVTGYLENLDKIRKNGVGELDESTTTEVVTINPAYFNNKLSTEIPQVIMINLRGGKYPHMNKVAALVKKPGALAPLEALLNPGKSTPVETAPPITTSNYSLSFLAKLNKLEPLIVPVDMKASAVPVLPFNNPPAARLNIETPVRSPKLNQLPAQPLSAEAYKNYVQDLHAKIAAAIKPTEKTKADDYLKNKKLTLSKDISNTALAAWLQNTPKASLYLYSKAVIANLSDGLAANNFSAILIMAGLPEKSIPILEYWHKRQPAKSTILANLGNAYYGLGDMTTAMKYLQLCVQKDSLNPTANKILCIMYMKKGDTKKAEEHGTKSLTTSYDEQVTNILRQLNNNIKPGEIMSRLPALPAKQFPMLQRIKLPTMPSRLDDMEQFSIELNAIKESLKITIADIEAQTPQVTDDVQQKMLMASFAKGSSPIRVKAQYIIMDGMQIYLAEKNKEVDVFRHHLKKINIPYNINVKAIQKKYNSQLNKLEGGEAGDEDKIAALELAQCKELNGEAEIYLAGLSRLVNQYAARQEYISRKYFRDYANWSPFWLPETSISFPSIEVDYLKDVLNILGEYRVITKMNCDVFEPLPIKEGELQEWEDEYCANFKGKFGIGPAKLFYSCKSWGIEAGEGIVGGFEVNYGDDGFEDVSLELGFGASWNMGKEGVAEIGAGASVKEFVKIGPDKITKEWGVTDAGIKGEIALEGEIGNVSGEVKVIEITAGYRSRVNAEGMLVPLLNLN